MKLLRPKASELMASIALSLGGMIELSCVLGKMDVDAATEIRQSIDETIAEAQEQDVLTKLLAISQLTFEYQTDVQTMQGALDTVRAKISCKPDFFAGEVTLGDALDNSRWMILNQCVFLSSPLHGY